MHELQERLSRHEQAALAGLKARLTREYEVQDIRLFGSKARGTAHSESDLDLFIVVPQLEVALHLTVVMNTTALSDAATHVRDDHVASAGSNEAVAQEGTRVPELSNYDR